MTSITFTTTRASQPLLLSLKAESHIAYLERIKPLFSLPGQKTIEQAMEQSDEKLALVGVLLYAIRPEMEDNEAIFDLEEEILARIDDEEYVASMEAIDEQKRILEAMSQGVLCGMSEVKRVLCAAASDAIKGMDSSLKGLSSDVASFHAARKAEIVKITGRIQHLSAEDETGKMRAQESFARVQGALDSLSSLEGRLGSALDKMDALKWKV